MDQVLTYEHMEERLTYLLLRFRQRYGGDLEELRSEAYVHLVRAWQSYREGIGSRTYWLCQQVWRGLQNTQRKQARRSACVCMQSLPRDHPQQQRFCMQSLLSEVSDDARAILSLTIGPHLDRLIHRKASTDNQRRALVKFLLQTGWTAKQIASTFQEIREALS